MDQVNQMNVFEFRSFTLDLNTVRLLKQGQVIEIEPQVFETLLLLVKNSKRVVTKDELMQEVWSGRLVTDNVIARTVYEIRKIIDFADDSQSMIRTVRGKGYQFIVDVKIQTVLKNSEVAAIEDEIKQSGLKKIMLLVLVVLLGLVLWYQNQQKLDVNIPKKIESAYPIIAVLPISVENGSEELSILTQSVVDYLTTQLALNLRMKVIHPDNMMSLRSQFDDVWSIQKATRANYIIEGCLEIISQNEIKINLTLYKYNENSELTPYSLGGFDFPYPHTTKDLNDLYKQRKITVREIVSLIKPGIIVSDDDSETDDPEAYRMVIAAHHIMRTDSCKEIYRAEQLLKNATERDPRFAYAWNQVFSNYFKRIWVCGESADNYQKALKVAEIVEKLAPNKYKAVAIARNGMLIERNQVELAFEYVRDSDWNDPDALYRKVYALRYAGFLNLASKNVNRILQLDPFYFNEKPIHQAPNTLLYLNRFENHLTLLAEPGNAYHDYYRGLNLLVSSKTSEAKVVLQSVLDKTPNDLFGRFSQALLYVLDQNNEAALKIVTEIAQRRINKNHSDGELTYKQVQIYAMAGDVDQALDNLQLAVNQGFFPVNYFLSDPAMESLSSMKRFKKIVDQATDRHLKFASRFDLEPETVRSLNLK